MRLVALKTSTECANQGITNSIIDVVSQNMFPTTATLRTLIATTAVRLATFIVSASKNKSGRRKRNQDQKIKQEKEKRKGKAKVFAMAQDSESKSDVIFRE